YEGVYRPFSVILRDPKAKIANNDRTFRRMLGLIGGRVYYNLLNWYRVLSLPPRFTANRHLREQRMGVRESLPDEIARGLEQAGTRERILDALRSVRMVFGLVRNHFT